MRMLRFTLVTARGAAPRKQLATGHQRRSMDRHWIHWKILDGGSGKATLLRGKQQKWCKVVCLDLNISISQEKDMY